LTGKVLLDLGNLLAHAGESTGSLSLAAVGKMVQSISEEERPQIDKKE